MLSGGDVADAIECGKQYVCMGDIWVVINFGGRGARRSVNHIRGRGYIIWWIGLEWDWIGRDRLSSTSSARQPEAVPLFIKLNFHYAVQVKCHE